MVTVLLAAGAPCTNANVKAPVATTILAERFGEMVALTPNCCTGGVASGAVIVIVPEYAPGCKLVASTLTSMAAGIPPAAGDTLIQAASTDTLNSRAAADES